MTRYLIAGYVTGPERYHCDPWFLVERWTVRR